MLTWLVSIPLPLFGQAAIVGRVTDPSDAPVRGVAVNATSPTLLEPRTTTTDAAGRYRLENLPPGTYRLTFTLPGWKATVLQGVDLTGSFTATADAQLVAGTRAETVTVIADLPAVDVYRATRELTLSGTVVRSLPTARSYNAILALVPGVVTSVTDTVIGPATTSFPYHGGRQNEGRLLLDGLNIGSPPSGNSATAYDIDVGQAHSVTFTTSGALGESETAGLVMNIVPKAGGNQTHGSVFASGTGTALQSSNVTPGLIARGVTVPAPYTKVYDISGTLGGPVLTDRVWYFASAHVGGSTRTSTNVFYNENAANPAEWSYAPDVSRPAYSDRTFENASGRLTWQLARRHRLSAFWDAQALCRRCTGATPGVSEPPRISPEAVGVLGRRLDVTQVTWSSPMTDRLLLEAGYGGTFFGVGNFEREPNPTRDLVRVVEQCATGCAANGNIPGLVYRSQDFSDAHAGSYLWKGSLTHVRGRHTLKAGYQQTLMTDDRTWITNDQNLTYRVDNGQPNQLTQSVSPWVNNARVAWNAVFVQDQWSLRRVTVQGALRYDRARSWFPRQQVGPSRFLATPIVVPETAGVDSYHDITPRFGVSYDPLGNGRTAIKLSLGRYLEGAGVSGIYGNTNPTLRMPQTTPVFGTAGVTRAWTDTNGNFVPDCDLLNPQASDMRASGGDVCGVMSNVNFGTNVLTNVFDPSILRGWGVRPSDWHFALSIAHQIGSRSSVDVTYTRRSFRGFTAADNLSLAPSDLTPFSIVAPRDARLPGGGGYTIGGLFDVVPEKAGQIRNLVTDSTDYGRWSQAFSGLDVTLQTRAGGNFAFAGGMSMGRSVADNCDVRASLPELATTATGTSPFGAGLAGSAVTPVSPYCRVDYGTLTQVRALSSYLVPRVGVQLAATVQSKPGPLLAANYAVPNALVAPSLGRNLSGNAANVTVNLVAPGSSYGDRINHLDLRVAKAFTAGGSRTLVGVDLYNALNSSAVLAYNNTFVPGGPWLQPLTVLTPRLVRITAEFEW